MYCIEQQSSVHCPTVRLCQSTLALLVWLATRCNIIRYSNPDANHGELHGVSEWYGHYGIDRTTLCPRYPANQYNALIRALYFLNFLQRTPTPLYLEYTYIPLVRPWSYEAETSGRRSLMGPTTTLQYSPQCLEICGFCRKKRKKIPLKADRTTVRYLPMLLVYSDKTHPIGSRKVYYR